MKNIKNIKRTKEKMVEEYKKSKEKRNDEEYKEKEESILIRKIDQLNKSLEENNVLDLLQLLGNRKKMLWTNLLAGISRGIGIGIGVTVITAILIIFLQKIVTLNIPVIGEYIADIVEIVQKSR